MNKTPVVHTKQNNQNGFLKGWLTYNLIGWGIGCLITIPAFSLATAVSAQIFSVNQFAKAKADVFTSIIIWFPFSAILGIMQWLKLKHLNVRATPWILATTLAWVIPAAFLSWFFDHYQITSFESWSTKAQVAEILIVGASVGLSQAVIISKSKLMPVLWAFANSIGFLALAFLAALVWGVGYSIGKSLEPFFFSLGDFGFAIVGSRELLLDMLVLSILPFLATLACALPTGLIFSKYGDERTNIDVGNPM